MSKSAAKIIKDHGAQKIADAIGVGGSVVRMWKKRNRIPAEHWRDLVAQDIATLEELSQTVSKPVRAA